MARNERRHRRIGRQQRTVDGKQPIPEIGDAAAFDVEIEHREKLAVAAGVGDERLAARVVDDRRLRYAVVRVPAEDRIDAAHARRELQIDVHPVVRQQHDRLRAFAARLVDDFLQRFVLDAERPLGDEVARIRDRRVRKRLADDRDRHAVDRAHHVGREHGIAEVGGLHVLREEVDPAGEILVDDFLHALRTERELPMAGHDVDAERFLRVDHVLAFRPQRRRRALPRVSAVEQQRAGTRGPQLPHQRREMRKAAELAVGPRCRHVIEVRERVRFARPRPDAEMLEQRLADEMRRAARRGADAEIDARLAEANRVELRVACR